MTTPFLIAHVTNALSFESAEIELEVATRSGDNWYTNDGQQVWPFWSSPITFAEPIPEGWLEHLQEEANRYAGSHGGRRQSLVASLGLANLRPATAPIRRRV